MIIESGDYVEIDWRGEEQTGAIVMSGGNVDSVHSVELYTFDTRRKEWFLAREIKVLSLKKKVK